VKKVTYKNHVVELLSQRRRAGGWYARATVIIEDDKKTKQIPILSRRRTRFDTQRDADDYALELAKLWIDGRTWGGNGRR
tara:strand:- start:136 stop:375 length:240 start_codon:yes stop_codon:yes gene_type:complete